MEPKLLSEILNEYITKLESQALTIKSLLLGPKEYLVLKHELDSITISDEFGKKELNNFKGYPIRVKVTQGVEPEIDVTQIHRYIKLDAPKEDIPAEFSNRGEVRDVGASETEGST